MTSSSCRRHARRSAGCPECNRIAAAYDRRRRAAKRAGTWKPQVPREQVQAHIDRLLDAGASLAGIADASGLSLRTLQGIRRRKWVQGDTAAAVFAVDRAEAPPLTGTVPLVGASRRVRALVAIGWSITEQARQLGWVTPQVWRIAAGTYSYITYANNEAIRALFERLCATPGGSTRAMNDARRKGWLPPLAWDDDIDDPRAEPADGEGDFDQVDDVAVERALAGERIRLTDAELVVALQAGVARGESITSLAERFGINAVGAKRMVRGVLTPQREKRQRIEAEIRRIGHLHNDITLAGLIGVHTSTVTRARKRLAEQQLIAS